MIKSLRNAFYTSSAVILFCLMQDLALAFPENIRHGYTNCQSCHVSPTGGGVLTEYGRRSSEEFMFTWSKPNEADFLSGAVKPPEKLNIGGDVRFLSLHKDNKITESNVGFPMQVDLELSYKFFDQLTVDLGVGSYDGTPDVRRYYLMYQQSENWYMRAGKFFPAFGIMNPDHSIVTRRILKFDQSQETTNFEAGYLSENFEWIIDAISGSGAAGMPRDDGYSSRFAYYIGKNNQVGASYLHGKGVIWERDVYGAFALVSLGGGGLLQTEIDSQTRKAIDSEDLSLPKYTALITFTRLSWELTRGLNIFGTYESMDPDKSTFSQEQRSYGPGIQWFPRPHLEFLAKVEAKLDEAYSKDYGNQALLMSHYYF